MSGRPPKNAAQARGIARAVERKAIKRYMGDTSQWDDMNKWYMNAIFEQERTGPAPKPFYSLYARCVAKRFGLPVPSGVFEL